MSIALAIRKAGGQVKLAQALGLTQQRISIWLKRDCAPNKYIKPIAELYGIPASTLLPPDVREALK